MNSEDHVYVQLNFEAKYLDTIGETRMWYDWTFYNDQVKNKGAALQAGKLYGYPKPYRYTSYYILTDFYDTEF